MIVEPDHSTLDTDMRTAIPGAILFVPGKPNTEIRAVSWISPFNGRKFPTTGRLIFSQYPVASNSVSLAWNKDLGFLQVNFVTSADFVQIDLIFDDVDIATLWAYDIT